jgi:PRTRC genetic system protein E
MFKELLPLIQQRPITLTVVSLSNESLRVCVIPQALESDKDVNDKAGHHKEIAKVPENAIKALTTPLSLEGTAEEIDAALPKQLTEFAQAHVGLQNTLKEAGAQIAQAVREIEDRNKPKPKAVKTGSDTSGKANSGAATTAPREDTLPLSWCAPPSTSTETTQVQPETAGKPTE